MHNLVNQLLLDIPSMEGSGKELPIRSLFFHFQFQTADLWLLAVLVVFLILLVMVLMLSERIRQSSKILLEDRSRLTSKKLQTYLRQMDAQQLSRIWKLKKHEFPIKALLIGFSALILWGTPLEVLAQSSSQAVGTGPLWEKGGIIITLLLLSIPTIFVLIFLFIKINRGLSKLRFQARRKEAAEIAAHLKQRNWASLEEQIEEQQYALEYRVPANALSGNHPAKDNRGLLLVQEEMEIPLVSKKKRAQKRSNYDPDLSKLVNGFLISATCWLLFGTTIGEYVGIKFVAPDIERISWLSFGRLRPVHTNAVFWGWASMAMIGLAYYVVPRVSNCKLYSMKLGWYSLILINLTVLLGSIALMAGINNGGGEYREYIWPIMLLFGIALALTLINYYKTIANRRTKEIYISNWYIVSAIIFTIVISLAAYLPFWQNGLGETIIQGYYMHQGVGMWFMLFTLGLVYYFLPQQLNKPIYSYSLGILAFWTQILFYTLIGSHHFVFSSIPWWLQTVAIVGSAGMTIPVFAGTTNFLMTFKGAWYKLTDSYTLPFFLVGIIFYFTGSMQGTAEAFRETNLIWHFTDFTVAHSHLTMYGIICFFLWACIYAIVPRFSGREAPQISIGAHFWLALIGMLMYTVPLMYGSTLKGLLWMEGKPFVEGLQLMAPHWLWRAIGGSLMWISHLFFAYNLYKMLAVPEELDLSEEIVRQMENPVNMNSKH